MKHIVILGDGMADDIIQALGDRTPLQAANKPNIDSLASMGEIGLVKTIPDGLSPGSDTANLSVLGYDPTKYYTGRSPLEAVSIGIDLGEQDISFRCNLVTLSEDEPYWNKKVLDHSADEITTEEADVLIKTLEDYLGNSYIQFHTGISYRHLLIWHDGSEDVSLTPPHDIINQTIKQYTPAGDNSEQIKEMMALSYQILNNHPINLKRREKGLKPANSIWIWGEGTKPNLPSFKQKYGMKGAMISAVDLLKGIGKCTGMNVIEVEGATGNIHTNFDGKAKACIDAIQSGNDFVYVHIEAPDECGHRGELENKVKSIELIDKHIVQPIKCEMDKLGESYKILILPDHPTPIAIRTHTSDPVPYLIYDSRNKQTANQKYDEISAKKSGHIITKGDQLMDYFFDLEREES